MVGVLPQLARLRGAALDLLFPSFCVGCGEDGSCLCKSCQSELPVLQHPLCPRCGLPQPQAVLCRACAGWQADIDGIRAPYQFEGTIRKAVHDLKYHNIRALAVPLAGLLSEYLRTEPIETDVIMPVPLHPRRLRERGYNQSALLARELGRLTGTALEEAALVRGKYLLPQARTGSVEERRSNVAGAFSLARQVVQDKRVLLIDDVSTSGATLNECASVLKAGGARAVWGLTLAREI